MILAFIIILIILLFFFLLAVTAYKLDSKFVNKEKAKLKELIIPETFLLKRNNLPDYLFYGFCLFFLTLGLFADCFNKNRTSIPSYTDILRAIIYMCIILKLFFIIYRSKHEKIYFSNLYLEIHSFSQKYLKIQIIDINKVVFKHNSSWRNTSHVPFIYWLYIYDQGGKKLIEIRIKRRDYVVVRKIFAKYKISIDDFTGNAKLFYP